LDTSIIIDTSGKSVACHFVRTNDFSFKKTDYNIFKIIFKVVTKHNKQVIFL